MAIINLAAGLGVLKSKPTDLGVNIANSTLFSGASTKSTGRKKSSSGTAPAMSDAAVLKSYVNTLYGAYKPPKQLTYEPRSKETLAAEIAEWLRPTYDAAIAKRGKATATYKAEIDADAIARGMGSSTYVTDMKQRQQRAEAEDVTALESDYAATLAKQLSAALETEQERVFEVAVFNAEAENAAYLKAYEMAMSMFAAYKADQRSSGGRSSGGSAQVKTTSAENCEAFLSGLSGTERKTVYSASTAAGAGYRAELIASVGSTGYVKLMQKYPADNRK